MTRSGSLGRTSPTCAATVRWSLTSAWMLRLQGLSVEASVKQRGQLGQEDKDTGCHAPNHLTKQSPESNSQALPCFPSNRERAPHTATGVQHFKICPSHKNALIIFKLLLSCKDSPVTFSQECFFLICWYSNYPDCFRFRELRPI